MNNTIRIYLKSLTVWLAIFFFFGRPAFSQDLQFERIPNELGLSQNLISALLQDRQGFIWVGTKDGLNRFDGYRFEVFQHDPFDSTSISDNNIKALLEDSQGRLWIATANGLNLMDREREAFQRLYATEDIPEEAPVILPGFPGLSGQDIFSLMEGQDGGIWAGTVRGGVVKIELPPEAADLDGARFTVFRPTDAEDSLWDKPVKVMAQDEQGTVWVHTRDRLCLIRQEEPGGAYRIQRLHWEDFDPRWPGYQQEDFIRTDVVGKEPDKRFYSLFKDRRGAVWIVSAGGFAKWLPGKKSFRLYPFDVDLADFAIMPLQGAEGIDGFIDRKGRIWIDGLQTLVIYDTLTRQLVAQYHNEDEHTPEFFRAGFHSLLEDANGNIWVGTNGNGLFKYTPNRKRFSGQADARLYEGESLRAICQTRDGTVWAGTTSRKLLRISLETGKAEPVILDESKWERPFRTEFDQVFALREDNAGNLWVAASRGLFRIRNLPDGRLDWKFFKIYQGDSEAFYPNVLNLHINAKGEIWLMTHFEFGQFDPATGRFDGHDYLQATGGEKEIGSNFPCIFQQDENTFWLGTSRGLLKYDASREAFTFFTSNPRETNSLSHPIVKCIHPGTDGQQQVLWIGTGGGGLNRMDIQTGHFTHFKKKEGLPDNVVYSILEDESGRLWMSTNQGLSRFSPQTGAFKNYGVENGLQDNEFNSGAYFKSRDGRLFFGGIRGFNVFFPSAVKDDGFEPPIVFTDFRLANKPADFKTENSPLLKPISYTQELELSWKDNIFTIEFAALDFTAPRRNQYAYKLENFDKEWQYIGDQRTATFTNLDPGEYVFQVKGTNHDGTWNEAGASLKITILPPWWKTWWAYTFYLLALGGAIFWAYRFQLNRKLEQAEAERIREMDVLKSRLYTNITHEFRTPLTVIMGMSKELAAKSLQLLSGLDVSTGEKRKLEQGYGLIHRNSENLLRLINQLLDLSKMDSGKLKLEVVQADIVPYLRYLTESFFSVAQEKEVHLVFQSGLERLVMDFDELKIQHIVYNLLSNAIKFTEGGGEVVFEAGEKEKEGNPALQIQVRDTGVGIPAEKLPYIFDRFYQVDNTSTRKGEGTGIGLALAKELVELMQGDIRVESEPGEGTVFTLLLPVKNEGPTVTIPYGPGPAPLPLAEPDPPDWPESEPGHLVDGELPLLLIVEDNPDVSYYIEQLLEDTYRIETANNGQAGIDKARELIPDIVISDVMMPEKDGFELAETLKNDERTSHIPIILLTAKATEEDRVSGLKTGADAYLMKPFNKEELFVRLEKLVELRRALQERYASAASPQGYLSFQKHMEQTEPSLDSQFLQKVRQAIDEKIGDPELSVNDLCEAAHVSYSQLFRKMKALTGEGPSGFIRKVRLHKARQLLQTTDMPVAGVAYHTGFTDPNYFSRVFSKEFDTSPSNIRK